MALESNDRNAKIDEYRRQLVRREVSIDSIDEAEVASAGMGPFGSKAAGDVVEFQEVRDSVRMAVADLPLSQGTALRLKYFEGLTSEAIAKRTGRGLRTIERDLKEGRDSVERSLVRGGIFHPEFGLAGLAAVVPSAELLSLSKELAASPAAASSVASSVASSGASSGAGARGHYLVSPVAKSAAAAVALLLLGAAASFLWPLDNTAAASGSELLDGVPADGASMDADLVPSESPSASLGGGVELERRAAVPSQPPVKDAAGAAAATSDDDPGALVREPALKPKAMTLIVTDHGVPVTGMTFGLSAKDDTGRIRGMYAKGPDSDLHVVEDSPGVYSVHAALVGQYCTFSVVAPIPEVPVNNTNTPLSEGYYVIRIERLIDEEPETINVPLNTAPRAFKVDFVEGQDFDLAKGISPTYHYRHVVNLQPAVWLLGMPRYDTIIEYPRSSTVPRWSKPYDGKLRFVATQPEGGDIRRVNGTGSIALWQSFPSSPAEYD